MVDEKKKTMSTFSSIAICKISAMSPLLDLSVMLHKKYVKPFTYNHHHACF